MLGVVSWCCVCVGGEWGCCMVVGVVKKKRRMGKWESGEGTRQNGDTTVGPGYEIHKQGNLSSIPCRPLTDVEHHPTSHPY